MKKLFIFLLLLCSASLNAAQDLKQVEFQGKKYYVFPETMGHPNKSIYKTICFNYSKLRLESNYSPTIIGNYPDGDYLIYYTEKRWEKKKGNYIEIESVATTFSLAANKKNGWLRTYDRNTQKIMDSLPYKDDKVHGRFNIRVQGEYSDKCIPNADFTDLTSTAKFKKFEIFWTLSKGVAEMNFENGIPVGYQQIYFYFKSKKYLQFRMFFDNGLLSGDFEFHDYLTYKRKKALEFLRVEGVYRNGVPDSVVASHYQRGKRIFYFNDTGRFTHEWVLNDAKRTQIIYSPGMLREIKKHLSPSDLISCNFSGYETSNKSLFDDSDIFSKLNQNVAKFCLIQYMNGKADTAFSDLRHINRSYMREMIGLRDIRDTMISESPCKLLDAGHAIRLIHSKSKDKLFLKDDTMDYYFKYYSIVMDIGKGINRTESFVYQRYYEILQKNLKNMEVVKLDGDSSAHYRKKLVLASGVKEILIEQEFLKGPLEGVSISYPYVRDTSLRLIRRLKIPFEGSELVLLDTMWQVKKNDYFELVLNNRYNSDIYPASNVVENAIEEFFKEKSVKHTAVLLNGKPFEGYLSYQFINWRKKRIKVNLTESKARYRAKVFYLNLYVCSDRFSIRDSDRDRKQYFISNGHFNGLIPESSPSSYDYKKTGYADNRMDGRIMHAGEHNKNVFSFDHGIKQGPWIISGYDYSHRVNFIRDKIEGLQLVSFSRTNDLLMSSEVSKNKFHGAVWILQANGHPLLSAEFKEGLKHGNFIRYAEKNDSSNGFFIEKMTYKEGVKTDTSFLYSPLGHLVRRAMDFEKIGNKPATVHDYEFFLFRLKGLSHSDDYERNDVWSLEEGFSVLKQFLRFTAEDALYRYRDQWFYTNGDLFAEGERNKDSVSGEWRFYREGNKSLYKIYQYGKTREPLSNGDSIQSLAKVFCFYPNGSLMYQGYTTNRASMYACDNELGLPIEEIVYSSFFDDSGRSQLKDGSGKITEYLPNGGKLREGQMLNFKREGVWIEYNRFGTPIAIGMYRNGMKQGHWFEGDLSGINFPENLCFMSEDEYNDYMSTEGKNVSVEEIYYVNGKPLNIQTYKGAKQ